MYFYIIIVYYIIRIYLIKIYGNLQYCILYCIYCDQKMDADKNKNYLQLAEGESQMGVNKNPKILCPNRILAKHYFIGHVF